MPKRVTADELQQVESAVDRFPDGVSLAQLHEQLRDVFSRRTLSRRLAELLAAKRIQRRGEGSATRYTRVSGAAPGTPTMSVTGETASFDTPDGPVGIALSPAGRNVLEYVSGALATRTPRGYDRCLLDDYIPNRTAYIPDKLRAHLHKIGKPIAAERVGGTFTRDIFDRFLIDLSWASSRLEGNTYSRLDTQRLIEFGQEAEGKNAKETQMILNHKAAIELLAKDGGDDIGINRYTLLNLHVLLSDNLMADPAASGQLRRRPVDIGASVFTPLAIPQLIEECLDLIIAKAVAVEDPFEQALFVMVHIPYLQPFEDVNKRVSRLVANIPLIKNNLCPLSFVDVPERAYIAGTLGVYEMARVELLRDVFQWAYERSCQRYVVIRDSVADPDLFRMKYRTALVNVIGRIVRERRRGTPDEVRTDAEPLVEPQDIPRFIEVASSELARLNEGNIARYRIRLAEFQAWNHAQRT
jgi:fido (protein-threonine AMPylation protein)